MIKLRLVHYANEMPMGFGSRGYDSTCGRYYISMRSDSERFSWAILDWKTHAYKDGFRYRRDAVAFAEAGGFDEA